MHSILLQMKRVYEKISLKTLSSNNLLWKDDRCKGLLVKDRWVWLRQVAREVPSCFLCDKKHKFVEISKEF